MTLISILPSLNKKLKQLEEFIKTLSIQSGSGSEIVIISVVIVLQLLKSETTK